MLHRSTVRLPKEYRRSKVKLMRVCDWGARAYTSYLTIFSKVFLAYIGMAARYTPIASCLAFRYVSIILTVRIFASPIPCIAR